MLASFADWLFAGVLFHHRYQIHPEVWRTGNQRQRIIAHADLQRAQYAELGPRKGPPRTQLIGHHAVSALTRFAS